MTRRTGLGRGLDAILPGDSGGLEGRSASGPLRSVAIDSIDPNPRQPRRRFDDEALHELAGSIASLGVLQPLLVRRGAVGRYELVAGERRLRAAQRARLSEVPVLVVETDERGSLERALVENVHRADLNPIEEAAAYKQLLDEGGLTQEELGRRLGRNRVTIANALRLLDLPVPIQSLVVEGALSAGHGRALLALQDSPFQERMARRAVQEKLSVRETEEQVRRYRQMSGLQPGGGSAAHAGRPPLAAQAQRILADHLQTRVRVDVGKRKGKIVLDFVSLEELERLLKVITGDAPGGSVRVADPGSGGSQTSA